MASDLIFLNREAREEQRTETLAQACTSGNGSQALNSGSLDPEEGDQ